VPILYGEGERALVRLQEEILKTTEDYTFLTRGSLDDYSHLYDSTRSRYEIHGVLASQLQEFKISKWSDWNYSDLMNTTHLTSLPFEGQVADIPPTLTAKGLHICLPVLKLSDDEYLAYLYCKLWRLDQLMCMPLMPDREHPGENRFVRKREGDPFSFVPEEKLKSFRLVTMFIQQTPHYPHKFTLDLHSRYFSVVTFEVSATAASAISQNCMIMTSWGNNTTSLSWKTLIEEGMNSYSIQLSALVVLKPRDAFFVMFGSKSGRLWCCCVLLGGEYLDLVKAINRTGISGRRTQMALFPIFWQIVPRLSCIHSQEWSMFPSERYCRSWLSAFGSTTHRTISASHGR
jgi:hypothetical protein